MNTFKSQPHVFVHKYEIFSRTHTKKTGFLGHRVCTSSALLAIAKLPVYISTTSISESLLLQTFCSRMIKNNFLTKTQTEATVLWLLCSLPIENEVETCNQRNPNEGRNRPVLSLTSVSNLTLDICLKRYV